MVVADPEDMARLGAADAREEAEEAADSAARESDRIMVEER